MNILLIAILLLGAIGSLSAVLLFSVSRKFAIHEDSRVTRIQKLLPGVNCGACGFPGCSGLATELVKADSSSELFCPVGGSDLMSKIAEVLGRIPEQRQAKIAVLHCNGNCDHRQQTNLYDGFVSCAIVSSLYAGNTACAYGCLGLGDCVNVCLFDALSIDPETLLPEIDEEKCTACGKCVKACPKGLFDLRKKGLENRRIYVNCKSHDKPAVTAKACKAGCISCKKCQKECAFDAIVIERNLAEIDDNKCCLCRKCVSVCPVNAISECNFPSKEL